MQAGAAAKKILSEGAQRIQVGVSLLDVADFVENSILEAGFGIAFPVNISLNEAAAHDTPSPDDTRTFAEGDMVKLELGVHLDGYIADTACTVDLCHCSGQTWCDHWCSWNPRCTRDKKPGVFAGCKPHRSWIRSILSA